MYYKQLFNLIWWYFTLFWIQQGSSCFVRYWK